MVRGYHSNIVSTPSYTPTLCACVCAPVCVWSPVGPDKSDGANCDSNKKNYRLNSQDKLFSWSFMMTD